MPDPITTTLMVRLPDFFQGRPRTVSAPTAFVRVQERPDGTRSFVAPRPDPLGDLGRAFRKVKLALGKTLLPGFFRQAQDMARSLEETLARINAVMRASQPSVVAANDLPKVAGLEARYYVRAALDPTYDGPDQLARLVRRVLAGQGDDDLVRVTRANRIAIAVSAMRGWEGRGEQLTPQWEPPLIAVRQWGSTRVEVRCG